MPLTIACYDEYDVMGTIGSPHKRTSATTPSDPLCKQQPYDVKGTRNADITEEGTGIPSSQEYRTSNY